MNNIFFKRSIEDISNENERLRQEIIQTDRLKSIATFASGMAHEIKNPLTSIKTFCEYLPTRIQDKEFLNTFIPIVIKDAERINELIHDLLDYAKPSTPQLAKSDIHKIIETVIDALSAKMIARKIEVIRIFNKAHIPEIPLDAKQIKQALLNIMLNSIEAMSENGHLQLTTQLSTDHKVLIITIADNGCGIPKEDLSRIFDPFFTKKEKGTGLGLSITHGIIKEHRGKIFVESTLGQGTTFHVQLPTQA
ncbi:MAG: ATP-binding protein [Candidatus Omnitrophica bacterium]|nr:ATP-binding protein [Candidatus Omnitrophota bacterium]